MKKQLMVKCCVFLEYLHNVMYTYIHHCGYSAIQPLGNLTCFSFFFFFFLLPNEPIRDLNSFFSRVWENTLQKHIHKHTRVLHEVYRLLRFQLPSIVAQQAEFNFLCILITCAGIQLIKVKLGIAN